MFTGNDLYTRMPQQLPGRAETLLTVDSDGDDAIELDTRKVDRHLIQGNRIAGGNKRTAVRKVAGRGLDVGAQIVDDYMPAANVCLRLSNRKDSVAS